jgi:hypothetical protein
VTSVPVRTNERLRESRLFSSIPKYLKRPVVTIFRIYTMYEPFKTFTLVGGVISFVGFLISLRYLYLRYFTMDQGAHIQSLLLSAVLLMVGFQVIMIGWVADLIGGLRRLVEDGLFRIKKLELGESSAAPPSSQNGSKKTTSLHHRQDAKKKDNQH